MIIKHNDQLQHHSTHKSHNSLQTQTAIGPSFGTASAGESLSLSSLSSQLMAVGAALLLLHSYTNTRVTRN